MGGVSDEVNLTVSVEGFECETHAAPGLSQFFLNEITDSGIALE